MNKTADMLTDADKQILADALIFTTEGGDTIQKCCMNIHALFSSQMKVACRDADEIVWQKELAECEERQSAYNEYYWRVRAKVYDEPWP